MILAGRDEQLFKKQTSHQKALSTAPPRAKRSRHRVREARGAWRAASACLLIAPAPSQVSDHVVPAAAHRRGGWHNRKHGDVDLITSTGLYILEVSLASLLSGTAEPRASCWSTCSRGPAPDRSLLPRRPQVHLVTQVLPEEAKDDGACCLRWWLSASQVRAHRSSAGRARDAGILDRSYTQLRID